jgi:hypothetical protein
MWRLCSNYKKRYLSLEFVIEVAVDVENFIVYVASEKDALQAIKDKIAKLGYL